LERRSSGRRLKAIDVMMHCRERYDDLFYDFHPNSGTPHALTPERFFRRFWSLQHDSFITG